jgi:hypothetical protein
MNKMVIASRTLLAFVVGVSLFLGAQERDNLSTFTTSFEFWVNGTRFPAGSYILDNSVPSTIIVRSEDGRFLEQAPTLVEGDAVNPSDSGYFCFPTGRCDLARIWGALGKRILTTHVMEADGGDIREVQIKHISASAGAKETH